MPKKTAVKPAKPARDKPNKSEKRKPTAKQLEAQKKQKAIEREFKKQQKRALSIIARGESKDYTFDAKLKDQIMKTPKKITPASIRRISAYTPDAIYKKASKTFTIDGKLVTLFGEKARKHDRSESARKGARKRKVTKSFTDVITGKLDIPKWKNPQGKPEEWHPDKLERYNATKQAKDEWYKQGVIFADKMASADSVAQKAWNDLFILDSGYIRSASPTMSKAFKRFLVDINKNGSAKAYERFLNLNMPPLTIEDFTSDAWGNWNNLKEYAYQLLNGGVIDQDEYDDIMEEIDQNYEDENAMIRSRDTGKNYISTIQISGKEARRLDFLNRKARRKAKKMKGLGLNG